jgi:intein-encoded DNA endonuclease-like protein
MAQKISNENHAIICKKYKDGINTPQLAKEYFVNATTIRSILIKNGVVVRSRPESNRKIKKFREEITNLYKAGKSSVKIAKKFEVNSTTILRELKSSSTDIKKSGDYRTYYCNFDFFEKMDCEEKAYWVGFIAADGAVVVRQNQSSLTISLSSKDRNHLEKFKKSIESEHKIRDYKTNGFDVSSISISNRKLVKDLKQYNIIQNKSLVYSMPENVPDDLLNHFIRGYMDGDGYVVNWKRKNRNNIKELKVGFCGTTEFLEDLKSCINTNLDLTVGCIYKTSNSPIFCLEYTGVKTSLLIKDYLYNNASKFMQRKLDKFTF